MKINVLHLCAWRMAIFKLDVVADWGISLLRTQLISYCWYYELQIKKSTYDISAYDTLEKSAGFLNIDFNQSSFWLNNTDIAKVFTTYQTFLYFCRNLNMFIKKKLIYFTRRKQISPDLSGVSGDFRIVWITT